MEQRARLADSALRTPRLEQLRSFVISVLQSTAGPAIGCSLRRIRRAVSSPSRAPRCLTFFPLPLRLHALAAMDRRLPSEIHEGCLDFLDSLWDARGGFHGHWADDHLDSEYTFYALLALGHLSL